jgi:tetratricopeptide (TPR) repeat protein
VVHRPLLADFSKIIRHRITPPMSFVVYSEMRLSISQRNQRNPSLSHLRRENQHRLLILRAIDDEASLVLAAGAIAARLSAPTLWWLFSPGRYTFIFLLLVTPFISINSPVWRSLFLFGISSYFAAVALFFAVNGQGVTQDYAKAIEWYEKAAAEDFAPAMYNLGVFYQYGYGVSPDRAKAQEWYEKAAAKDNTDAMFRLGSLYYNGEGVTQDYAKAIEWYEKAADKDNAPAMYDVGVLYQNGQGVTQDYAKAIEWYEKAADKDNAPAM